MSFYSVTELIASFIAFLSAMIFYRRNPYENLNRGFALAILLVAGGIYFEYLMIAAGSYNEAYFMIKLSDTCWLFAVAAFLPPLLA